MTSQDRWLPFIAVLLAVIGTAILIFGAWDALDRRTTPLEQRSLDQQRQIDHLPGGRP